MSKSAKGLALIFIDPNLVLRNPIANAISTEILHQPIPTFNRWGTWGVPGPASPEVTQLCALSGVVMCGISSAYGISLYHGFDEWIYISVPGRLGVAALGLMVLLLRPEVMSPLLFSIVVWDGSMALITGWILGTWSGRRLESGTGSPAKDD